MRRFLSAEFSAPQINWSPLGELLTPLDELFVVPALPELALTISEELTTGGGGGGGVIWFRRLSGAPVAELLAG